MIEPRPNISFAEFTAWEQEHEDVRHELIGGEIIDFAGGSLDHERICMNIVNKLDASVDPPCQAFGSSTVIESVSRNWVNGFRADAVVSCSLDNVGDALFAREPLIVVEVLSLSNSGRKWDEKLFEYWNTPSIAQLVFVESKVRYAAWYLRNAAGMWLPPIKVQDTGVLSFPPIGASMLLDQVYARTSLANEASPR